jgi:phage tail-like protein
MAIRPPLADLVFVLEVAGMQPVTFKTCSGLGSTSEVIEHKIVERDREVIEMIPGRLKWPHLVLERGLDPSAKLWTWRQLILNGKLAEARRNGAVVAMTQEGRAVLRWGFVAGWPCGWSVSSAEDAGGLAVERLEIVHQGLTVQIG